MVVTYRPELATLRRMLEALAPQVAAVCIVDNSDDTGETLTKAVAGLDIHQVRLGRNRGIGYAQNIGIHWAMETGASHVLLMDQDSIPAHDMVRQLLAGLQACESPAGVGPLYRDPQSGELDPFVRIEGLGRRKIHCSVDDGLVLVDTLIASGCLIPMPVLKTVGLMRADLFIDYVDLEWGLRARRLGFRSYGVCAAQMDHSIGETRIRLGNRRILAHSPLRHYYQVRNLVLFLREPTAFLAWRILDLKRLLQMLAVNSVAKAPRLEHVKMMGLGLWHGLIGRSGSYEDARAGRAGALPGGRGTVRPE